MPAWVRDQPMLHLCLSYQSWCSFFFFISFVIGVLFRVQVVLNNGCSVLQLSFSGGCGRKGILHLTTLPSWKERKPRMIFIHKYGKFKVNYLVPGCICPSVTETKQNLWDWLNLHTPFILSPLSLIHPKGIYVFRILLGIFSKHQYSMFPQHLDK